MDFTKNKMKSLKIFQNSSDEKLNLQGEKKYGRNTKVIRQT